MFIKKYNKYKERRAKRIKEKEVLKKIHLANQRKIDKLLLIEKVNQAHLDVLNSYKDSGIKVNPLKIFKTQQEILQKIVCEGRENLGLPYDSEDLINGMYLSGDNAILLDSNFVEKSNPIQIKHTIAHEYGHNLFDRFFSDIHINRIYGKPFVFRVPRLPLAQKNKNWIDKIENKDNLSKKRITDEETRRIEFDEYFEEMFVDSAALYINGIIDGEIRFFPYSKCCQGEILGKDKQFMGNLEDKLYDIFYDRMFTKGLKHVVAELPFAYMFAREAFEKRHKKQIIN